MLQNVIKKARIAPLLALLALSSLGVWAQSTQGGVHGAVTDASGAAVPNAKVTLTNEGTNEARNSTTNSAGFYDFSNVVPATYTVVAETPSFKKFERKNVIVGTQEYVAVDIRLEVGNVSESVLVTEQMPLVESSNASQGQVLDNQKLVELPNLGRNPFMMSRLSQNVVQVGPPAYNRMEDQSGSSMISIAGGPVRGNNYLLDGIPITDSNNRAIIIPTLESVQEVKIQSNTYDAEMARTGGGMFNTLMKSGTNDYHGSLYGHVRRTSMDANNFFSNEAGIPITNQPNTTWGGSFGGHVSIPKLYNGKNKTFFFLGVEHYDDWSSDSSQFNLPTALERTGDFSKSFNADGSLHVIYDPRAATATPLSGNKIPLSLLNPVGLATASYYPTPTSAPASFGAADLTLASTIKARAVQYTGKIDEDFTSWWRASLSYLRYYSLEPGDTWFNSPATQSGWRLLRRVDTTQLNNLFTINPTTVVAVRYGFNRFPNFDYNSSQGFNVSTLGFSPTWSSISHGPAAEFPSIGMSTFTSLGESGDWDYYDEASHNFSVSVDKYMGRHSLKAGVDYRLLATSGSGINCTTGCFSFNNAPNNLGPSNTSYTGTALADLLVGAPYDRTADTTSTLTDFIHYYAGYVQDNFRVNSKLTLNFGLRMEHESGVSEKNNGLLVGFNQTAANVLAASVPSLSLKGVPEYAGVNGAPTTVGNYQGIKWGPRGGVAYQLNAKTVLRGGYGIFWAPQIYLGGPFSTIGYANTTEFKGQSFAQLQSTQGFYNPFPNGLTAPVGNTLGASAGLGSSLSLVDPTTKAPMIQQYSADVQRELPGGIALEVGYVGSHSTHLTLGMPAINVNALNPSLLSQGGSYLDALVANPFAGAGLSGTLAGQTSGCPAGVANCIARSQLLLPFPAYTSVNETFGDQNHASYNSMVIKAQKRFSHGLTFLSTLTLSKNMDESSGGVGTSLNGGAQGAPQNPYNMAAEYSLSNVDTPVRWATAITYELPIGKGKMLMANANKATDLILGGWSVNAVSVYQTGFPLQIYQSNNNSNFGYGAQRPNEVSGATLGSSGSVESRLNDYINYSAFTIAPEGTFGSTPRTLGSIRGPGQKNWDLSIFKNFAITERFKAQFRAEALNGFNSPLFHTPDTNLSDGKGVFGVINTTDNFARQLQLAIRVTF
jgi:hypothetical protein